jgi:hypothetical protein
MDAGTETAMSTWGCARCKGVFIDADVARHPGKLPPGVKGYEPQEYWIGPTEPICVGCAQELHLAQG